MELKIRIFRTATSFTPGDQGFMLYGVPGCGKCASMTHGP